MIPFIFILQETFVLFSSITFEELMLLFDSLLANW